MKIGIIGAGQIGGTLTRRLRAVGHEVMVANSRGPASLAALARETGALAATPDEVVRDAELVVLTIPLRNVESLAPDLFAKGPRGQVVIDTGNYYPRHRDGRIADIESGTPESAWVQRQIGRRVVKVFNSIFAQSLLENGRPKGTPGRIALAVAGDLPQEKAIVATLLDELGFDSVDAGTIADSWRQQPGSPGYCRDFDAAGVRAALQAASAARTPEWRATDASPGNFDVPQ
ncbi:NADPH-dependent F420 reductase [Mitsuaria sp. 7]|uniref:NADPH-dependent F420 reductase n=1 Tax=Mitsuaria sp. 7 TaxID=1658665 RepID=UPI0007DD07FA|nr:NAD(P)-binding domain-containing protein [Mitsuaria sp. 7]ANH67393.1 NADP oxidoreductase [Mitsuaria sp. 7]